MGRMCGINIFIDTVSNSIFILHEFVLLEDDNEIENIQWGQLSTFMIQKEIENLHRGHLSTFVIQKVENHEILVPISFANLLFYLIVNVSPLAFFPIPT